MSDQTGIPARRRWLVIMLGSVFWATYSVFPAQAAVILTVSASNDNQNLGYKKSEARSGSLSLELTLGDYVRIGMTHEQMQQKVKGFDKETDSATDAVTFKPVDDTTHVIANSFDLTLALYNGEIFTPFIRGGIVLKSYKIQGIDEKTIDPDDPTDYELGKPEADSLPTWLAGVGLSIRLNRQFSLRLAHTLSPGGYLEPGDDENKDKRAVLDRKSTFGLSYQFQ